jgi:hypothetical protein
MGYVMDEIEKEYIKAIARASANGDNDIAQDLSVGLKQYRELYKEQDA